MDLSPPSLSRSPVSSPNTDYPSPDLVVDPHYKLASMYDTACEMGSHLDSENINSLPPLDSMTSADWPGTTLVHATTSVGIPSILSAEYDPFANYDPALSAPYSHDIYPSHTAQAQTLSHSPQHLNRTLSHSPDPSSRHSYYTHSGSPTPRVKMEGHSDYPNPLEISHYPSPHSTHATPVEVGTYGQSAGNSGYLSDVPSGTWSRSEYPPLDPEPYPSSSSAPRYSHDRQSQPPPPLQVPAATSQQQQQPQQQTQQPYRLQRAPRRHPRRLTTKEDANFQCEVKGCGKLFSRSYNYKAHLETHDEKREYPFPCTVENCTKKFVRKTDLQRHHQSVHMKERNHKCDYCGRMFARKDTLRRHMDDGCSKRFDIGTLDLRSEAEGYEAFNSRSTSGHLAPPTQLPPMTGPQPPRSPAPNVLEPVTSLMRRGY